MRVATHAEGTSTWGGAFRQRVLALGVALFPARVLLFLALFFFQVQVAVRPGCIFFAQNDLFLCNYRFLHAFLVVPGGLAEWAGRFVLQACHYGWPGAAILTAIAWLVCIGTVKFLQCLSPAGAGVAWTLPALVLLVVHSRYDYAFSVSIGAALAMWAAFGYARASARWARWRIVLFAVLCILVYYLIGAAFYVFAACSLIYEFYSPASRVTKLSLILVAAGAKFAVDGILGALHPGLLYFHVSSHVPFQEGLSLSTAGMALYGSFPVCALVLADRTSRYRREDRGKVGSTGLGDGCQRLAEPVIGLRWVAATVLFMVVAALAAYLALRRDLRTVLTLHQAADSREWDEVLRLATDVTPDLYSQYVVHDVNQALYHTGRLPFDMFSYPQSSEPFVRLLVSDPYVLLRRRLCDFHLQLGRLNDAEFHAHEDLTARPSAECLRRLAWIAIVKGRVEAARLFLNILRDDFVYGAWANDYLRRLQEDPTLSGDAEVARVRELAIAKDDIHYATAPPTSALLSISETGEIPSLLRQEPPNRMAFEYTMARYLIMRDVEAVVRLLPVTASFGYAGTPPLYEEAAMIYARTREEKTEDPGPEVVVNGCRISEQTLSKIGELDARTDSGRLDPIEVSNAAEGLGLAYFRYYYGRGIRP